MRATGALPTELRVQKMNDVQWLWYYLNLQKDLEEDRDRTENYLDYMGSWVNPELAKSVMSIKNKNKNKDGNDTQSDKQTESKSPVQIDDNTEIVYGDTAVNDTFEDEFKRALAEAGLNEKEFTELPDSQNAGDPTMSQNDFIGLVQQFEQFAGTQYGLPKKQENIVDAIDPLNKNSFVNIGEILSDSRIAELPNDLENIKNLIPNVIDMNDLDYFDGDEE